MPDRAKMQTTLRTAASDHRALISRACVLTVAAGLAVSFGAASLAQPPVPAKPVTKPKTSQPGRPGAAKPPAAPPTTPTPSGTNTPPSGIPGADADAGVPANGAGGDAAPGMKGQGAVIKGDMIQFGPFAEGVDLRLLIDLVIDVAKVQILITDDSMLSKKVVLTAPLLIPRKDVLNFLDTLLEQKGAVLTMGDSGIYFVRPSADLVGRLGEGDFSTTQVIPTSGLRPSALQNAINAALRQGGNGAPGSTGSIAFLDDLGVILMTDTPRRIESVKAIVQRLTEEQNKQDIITFDLKQIAASVAKQRLLELLGRSSGSGRGQQGNFVDPNNPGAGLQPAGSSAVSLSDIADRLKPDPMSNMLIFRGRKDEQEFVAKLLKIIDRPNALVGKWYPVGGIASQIAQQGKQGGLGEVISLQNARGNRNGPGVDFLNNQAQQNLGFGQQGQRSDAGGPTFVLDVDRGFMYYGTPEQQVAVQKLVAEFGEAIRAEEVETKFYKLKHAKAEDTASIIQGLLNNQVPSTSNPLLPSGGLNGGGGANAAYGSSARTVLPPRGPLTEMAGNAVSNAQGRQGGGGSGSGEGSDTIGDVSASDNVFVLADKNNNQIVVKAPRRMQSQFAALIDKLDLRRPQVYIDAKILAVNSTETFQLAVETQFIIANGTGGAINTNFGLGTFGNTVGTTTTNGNFDSAKNVVTSLAGVTAAIIKSQYVPIIINALAKNIDTEILATPQLLVDDNTEAMVSSLDEQPTTSQSQSGAAGSTLVGFSGYEPAGPSLKVTPQISEGNYLKLKYEIELSAFDGDSQNLGSSVIPPPKLDNKIKADSVTVPSDATIIIGGLTFNQTSSTIIKVPLLGDIPLVGELFRSTTKSTIKRTLYVFLTPRIMRDQTFADLRLLTRGPAAMLHETDRGNPPPSNPVKIDLLDSAPALPRKRYENEGSPFVPGTPESGPPPAPAAEGRPS